MYWCSCICSDPSLYHSAAMNSAFTGEKKTTFSSLNKYWLFIVCFLIMRQTTEWRMTRSRRRNRTIAMPTRQSINFGLFAVKIVNRRHIQRRRRRIEKRKQPNKKQTIISKILGFGQRNYNNKWQTYSIWKVYINSFHHLF